MMARASPSVKYGTLVPLSRRRGRQCPMNALLEAERQGRLAETGAHEGVEPAAELQPVAALEAGLEVALERLGVLASEGAVQVLEEAPLRVRAAHGVHGFSPLTSPRWTAQSHSRRSRVLRPRCSLDMTVPTGHFRTSASSR